jgi:cytochrome P450
MNGDDHKRYRAVIANRFTPRAVEAVRPLARETAHQLVDRFAARGRCELMSEFAAPYVATGTCEFLGFSLDDVAPIAQGLDVLAKAAKDPQNLDEYGECIMGLVDYTSTVLAERQRHPGNDVLSTIAEAANRGDLPGIVASGLVTGLLSAGHGPTINQLGIMVELLSREPDTWRAVGEETLGAASIVEEVLRLRSTNQVMSRRAERSFEYNGVVFAKDEHVLIGLAAANRDPRRFSNPDRFDLQGNDASHLAFGFGSHFCLGAALARVQLQEALLALSSRLSCPQVVESVDPNGTGGPTDPSMPPGSAGLVGPLRLDIKFSPAPRQTS